MIFMGYVSFREGINKRFLCYSFLVKTKRMCCQGGFVDPPGFFEGEYVDVSKK